MKHGTSTAAIFVLIVVIVILALVIFLGERGPKEDSLPEDILPETETEKPEAGNVPQNPPEQEQPEEQEPEEPEEEPEETPEETEPEEPDVPVEEPQPEQPQFVPRSLGSGSFRSDTGVPVNLVANWSAKTVDSSTVEFTVDVYVESYTLHAGAAPGGLIITVYGNRCVVDLPEIMVETSNAVQTHMATRSFSISLSDGQSATVPVQTEWKFGGVYSGTELPVVSCGGDAVINR